MRYATMESESCTDFVKLYNQTTQLNITLVQRQELQYLFDSNYDNYCVKRSFFCVNQKLQKVTGPWEKATLSKAKKKCDQLDSTIKTPNSDLNLTNVKSFWTGSKRWNRLVFEKDFEILTRSLNRTHFKREDGHLFDPKKSPEQTRLDFSEAVHLLSNSTFFYIFYIFLSCFASEAGGH